MRSPAQSLARPSYYFRRVVPRDLRRAFAGRQESLRTADRQLAEQAWLRSSLRWSQLVVLARKLTRKLTREGRDPAFEQVSTLLLDPCEEVLPIRCIGIDTEHPERVFISLGGSVERTPMASDSPARSSVPTTPVRDFANVAEDYVNDNRDAWTEKTQGEYDATFRLFGEVLKGIPFRSIDRSILRAARDRLRNLPPGWKKSPVFRSMSLEDVLRHQEARARKGKRRTVSVTTFNKWWDTLKALFRWAVLNKETDANYAGGLNGRGTHGGRRRAFTGRPSCLDGSRLQVVCRPPRRRFQ